ncbi:two pore domain potassium channel family protein [Candidatus Woesearchaeota archaeon]|nr:two pore domain potassium channel family protein [Candidatus Woesearchaeota archaeon]
MRLAFHVDKFIRKVDFDLIIIFYFLFIILFGSIFFLLSFTSEHGIYDYNGRINTDITGYVDAIYFSFVTSTSLGYGDIRPLGVSRIFSVIEVVLSLFIFGIAISKIFSVKQEKILSELYDFSFQERVTRIISGLYNFRAEIDSVIHKLNERLPGQKQLTKHEIEDQLDYIEGNLHAFTSYLIDINKILIQKEATLQGKLSSRGMEGIRNNLSDFKVNIILDNLRNSMEKIEELITALNERKISWKTKAIVKNLETVFGLIEGVCIDCISIRHTSINETIRELRMHAGIGKR